MVREAWLQAGLAKLPNSLLWTRSRAIVFECIASWCGSTTPTESSTFDSSERTECTTPLTRKRFEDRAIEIVPIKTERDYRRTLKEIEGLPRATRRKATAWMFW